MNPIPALIVLIIFCAVLGAAGEIPPHQSQHRHEVCPGATYFYSGKPPAWARHMRVVCRIGDHVFLTDNKRNDP
ncbi:MAG TPA: hypothetical protein VF450_02940 [Noviherbaspirillum sp.]